MANQHTLEKQSTCTPQIPDIITQNLNSFLAPLLTIKFTNYTNIFLTHLVIMPQSPGTLFLPHIKHNPNVTLFIYLFGVLHRFQNCIGHITTGSWKGRGNQYIQFVRVLYCKLPTNSKQLPAFPV